MNAKIICTAIAAIMVMTVASSCKKSKNGATTIDYTALIIGKWQLDSVGLDGNGNGKIDPGEITQYSPLYTKTETYNNSGKMFDSASYGGSGGYFQSFGYVIATSGRMQLTSLDTSSIGTVYHYQIQSISSTQVKLFDSAATPYAMYIYKKQ